MTNLGDINLTIILIMILILEITILVFGYKFLELKKQNNLDQIRFNFNYNVGEIDKNLDVFISNVFFMYIYTKKYNLTNSYISPSEEEQMYEDVVNMVLDLISIPLLEQVYMIYNKQNIHQIINNKVIAIVVDYCISVNNNTKK